MKLLVTMAVPRKDITDESIGREGYMFVGARIEILDWDTKECIRTIEYTPPREHLGEGCSVRFTGGCPYKGKWYQTSGTELIVYNVKDWSVEKVFSHPSFHDLHGVAVVDDEIVIVNTGLDMLQFLSAEGEIVREVNLASVPTWERFDRDTDYRCVISTKPHEIHPNHALQIDGQWWVTRALQRDAINLRNPRDRFDIGVGNPHDGIIRGDHIFFTTTNANLVIAEVATRKVEEIIDLNQFNPRGSRIGWCRGLEVVGDEAYIGFTRVRHSKWSEVFRTARNMLRGSKRKSHIERINFKQKELVDWYDYETDESSALFTLMSYDRVEGKLPV